MKPVPKSYYVMAGMNTVVAVFVAVLVATSYKSNMLLLVLPFIYVVGASNEHIRMRGKVAGSNKNTDITDLAERVELLEHFKDDLLYSARRDRQ